MKKHLNNLEAGRAGGIDCLCNSIFIWPSQSYFYEFCTVEEWLNGIHEFNINA